MNVKTFKRLSRRSLSMLMSVLMVLSLFTVCMVGTATTASAADGYYGTVYVDASAKTDWSASDPIYMYIGHNRESGFARKYILNYNSSLNMWTSVSNLNWERTAGDTNGDYYFFSNHNLEAVSTSGTSGKTLATLMGSIDESKRSATGYKTFSGSTKFTIASDGALTGPTVYNDVTSTGTGWIDATLYNYRTNDQINAAKTTTKTDFEIDTDNTLSHSSVMKADTATVYGDYNAAVEKWFETDNAAVNTTDFTPLYQGNFHDWDGNDTVLDTYNGNAYNSYVKNLFHFVQVANSANRNDGSDTAALSTHAVAANLVDTKLNENNTITQNGVELPQFSNEFMNAHQDEELQSIYEGLSFQFKTTKKNNGNIWYSYNSQTDGNRYLNNETKQVVAGSNVHGYNSALNGYFPFDETQYDTSTGSIGDNNIFSFGTRFDINFTMPTTEDNKVNGEDLQFEFTGDDDVWVFIDGYLALDLGGSHTTASGYINLSEGISQITSGYYDATYSKNSSTQYNTKATVTDGTTTNLLKEITTSLADKSKVHTLTVFQLERGLHDSNFSMNFILPQSNSLTVSEKIDTSDVNPGLVTKALETANNDVFDVQIQSDSKSASSNQTAQLPIEENFARENPDGTTTILQKAGTETATGTAFKNETSGSFVPVTDTTFVWTDTGTTAKGTGIANDNGGVELLYNQSGTFYDQFTTGSSLKITQSDSIKKFDTASTANTNPPTSGETDRTVSDYYSTSYKLTDIAGSTISWDGKSTTEIPFENADGTDSTNVKLTAEIENTVKVGSISFKKSLDEGSDTSTVFSFKVEMANVFGGTNSTWFVPTDTTYTLSNDDGSEDGILGEDGIITMMVGDTVKIEGVPVGTKYRITEVSHTNDESKSYSVVEVNYGTNNSDADVVDLTPVTGGITATVGTVDTGDSKAEFDYVNSQKTTTVVYRFKDRAVVNGVPTEMEDHYTYFTRSVPGTLSTTDLTASTTTIKNYAPEIENVLSTYTLKTVEYRQITTDDLKNAEGLDTIKLDGKTDFGLTTSDTVFIATYEATDKTYTVTFEYPELNEDGTATITSKSFIRPFNGLISVRSANNKEGTTATAPKSYKDANGNTKNFLYWARQVSVGGEDSGEYTYTPVSTEYIYGYRVTNNVIIRAIYTGDEYGTELNADGSPKVEDDYSYHVNKGDNYSGYDASSAIRLYDSYSVDKIVNDENVKQDRIRINVVFGAVGSPYMDQTKEGENITDGIEEVGYVLLRNSGDYANDTPITEAVLKDAIANQNTSTAGTPNYTTVGGYQAMVNKYSVNPVDYDEENQKSDYQEQAQGTVNLTNKNRVNFVFDITDNSDNEEFYFTCYTYMIRKFADGSATTTYVSNTPAYFNIKEAKPEIEDVNPTTEQSYQVLKSVNNPNAGTFNCTSKYFTDGQRLNFVVETTDYDLNGTHYKSTVESIQIGEYTIPKESLSDFTIKESGKSVFYIEMSAKTLLGENYKNLSTLNVKANFTSTKDETVVTVRDTETRNGGKLLFSTSRYGTYTESITVAKGTTVYVKAVADSDATFTGWEGITSTANPQIITVNDSNYTLPTPNFLKNVTFTLVTGASAGPETAGGSVTVSASNDIKVDGTTYSAAPGTVITVTAAPDSGYQFKQWHFYTEPDGISSTQNGATITFTVTENFAGAYIECVAELAESSGVYFANTAGWDNVYVYSYGTSEAYGAWPGTQLNAVYANYTRDDTNAYDLYQVAIPDGCTGLIFTSSKDGPQTVNIEDPSDGAVYELDGTGTSVALGVKTESTINNWHPYVSTDKTVYFAFIDQEEHNGTNYSGNLDNRYPKDCMYAGYAGTNSSIDASYWYGLYAYMYNSSTSESNTWKGDKITENYVGKYKYTDRSNVTHYATLYSVTVPASSVYNKIMFVSSNDNSYAYMATQACDIINGKVYFSNGTEYNDNGTSRVGCTSNNFTDWTPYTVDTINLTAPYWTSNDSAVVRVYYTDVKGTSKYTDMTMTKDGSSSSNDYYTVEISDLDVNSSITFKRINSNGTGASSSGDSVTLSDSNKIANSVYSITLGNFTY